MAGRADGQAIAMQIGAVHVEPDLGAMHGRTQALEQAPEAGGMIHFDQMRDFMRRQIVEHDPQRLDWSRMLMRLILTESSPA